MKPILEIQNISKKYRIEHLAGGYLSLRERMMNMLKVKKNNIEDFWALKDVCFEVQPGESIGIVGRNGAGKSTLLKILSRITPPTTGNIISRGRIASLLEVGTGFHPELTGRENIFFNGSLLGMRRKEIERKLDEIVDFSGVENFLDTPLKHFSSGMQLRLAFAVSAFLEPEILIIDEVLAVGDSIFQAKCIQKMAEISSSGKSILFVSHNLSIVRNLCKKAIVLDGGSKKFEGLSNDAIDFYNKLSAPLKGREINLLDLERKIGRRDLIFSKVFFDQEHYEFRQRIFLSVQLKSLIEQPFEELDFGINFIDKNEVNLVHLSNKFIGMNLTHSNDALIYEFEVQNLLRPGQYKINLFLRTKEEIQDFVFNVGQFEVSEGNPYNYLDSSLIQGAVFPDFSMKVKDARSDKATDQ